jgi:hypothetical protein
VQEDELSTSTSRRKLIDLIILVVLSVLRVSICQHIAPQNIRRPSFLLLMTSIDRSVPSEFAARFVIPT